jgi:hypothetical protein
MVMNIHSDASYLSKGIARSQTCGHFCMGWMPQDDNPICINGAFHVSMNVTQFIVASAAETELGALFHNCQTITLFAASLKIWGTNSQKPLSFVIMQWPWALQTEQ